MDGDWTERFRGGGLLTRDGPVEKEPAAGQAVGGAGAHLAGVEAGVGVQSGGLDVGREDSGDGGDGGGLEHHGGGC